MHHGVRISDAAIIAAVQLSQRYIAERFLPDKAIDLVDEAASRLRMQIDSKPEELDELDRRVVQLKIERAALTKETDEMSRERLARLETELGTLEEELSALSARWQAEKTSWPTARKRKRHWRRRGSNWSRCNAAASWSAPANWPMALYPNWNSFCATGTKLEAEDDAAMLEQAVNEDHIASVVSRWTGIPVDKMLQGERQKLLDMETALHARVVGKTMPCLRWHAPCAAHAPVCKTRRGLRAAFVSGADRCRQDRTDQGAGRIFVR